MMIPSLSLSLKYWSECGLSEWYRSFRRSRGIFQKEFSGESKVFYSVLIKKVYRGGAGMKGLRQSHQTECIIIIIIIIIIIYMDQGQAWAIWLKHISGYNLITLIDIDN